MKASPGMTHASGKFHNLEELGESCIGIASTLPTPVTAVTPLTGLCGASAILARLMIQA
jgi:hypothetical protein